MINRRGIDHVTLTVSDINQTKEFYDSLFQTKFEKTMKTLLSIISRYSVWFVHRKTASKDRFDETRVGLDHISFHLEALEELESL